MMDIYSDGRLFTWLLWSPLNITVMSVSNRKETIGTYILYLIDSERNFGITRILFTYYFTDFRRWIAEMIYFNFIKIS